MTHFASLKSHRNAAAAMATIQCHSQSRFRQNLTNLAIISFSEPSSSSRSLSSSSLHLPSSVSFPGQECFPEKNLKNGRFSGNGRRLVSKMQLSSRAGKKRLWRNLLSGSKKFKSVILLNIITIVYASNVTVIKDVEAFTDPAYFCAIRFVLSAIPFSPFIFRARDDVQIRNSGLELGLWVSLGYLSEALGLLTSDAGRVSFISLFTVIIIPLLESVLGVIVPARTWFGILMSMIGIFMLESSGSPPNIGDLFSFISAIFFGVHTLRTEHISRTTSKDNLLALLGYEVSVVAALSTIWCLTAANFDSIQHSQDNMWTWSLFWDWMCAFPWIPAFYTGVFSTGICLWGEIAAMREVSATETAVIYGMEPLWGAGFAWFLLGERWEGAGWIGAALILGGSLTVQLYGAEDSGLAEGKDGEKQGERMIMSPSSENLRKTLSASPVMARSRNNVVDMLNK